MIFSGVGAATSVLTSVYSSSSGSASYAALSRRSRRDRRRGTEQNSVSLFMYVEDVDATVKQAVDAGATVTMEVADQFWATASKRSPIRMATCGRSRRASRTSLPRKSPRGPWHAHWRAER